MEHDAPESFRLSHVYAHSPAWPGWIRELRELQGLAPRRIQLSLVYCLFRERWYPNEAMGFSVDHVIPRSTDRGGPAERDYNNLIYACNRCNSIRGVAKILNPTRRALGEHLEFREEDGSIMGRTEEGRRFVKILRLNEAVLRNHRRHALAILDLKRQNEELLLFTTCSCMSSATPKTFLICRRFSGLPMGNTKPGKRGGLLPCGQGTQRLSRGLLIGPGRLCCAALNRPRRVSLESEPHRPSAEIDDDLRRLAIHEIASESTQ